MLHTMRRKTAVETENELNGGNHCNGCEDSFFNSAYADVRSYPVPLYFKHVNVSFQSLSSLQIAPRANTKKNPPSSVLI